MPHLSGIEASKKSLKNRGIPQSVRLFLAGLHDRARVLVGLPAAYLKVAGPPGSNSFMELPDEDMHLYLAKHPEHYMVSSARVFLAIILAHACHKGHDSNAQTDTRLLFANLT